MKLRNVHDRHLPQLREPYMLERLRLAATPGSRVFAAVGEGHVCNIRAALGGRRGPG